ncbi:S1 motif domain-containing protein [Durusdinium trenchii]|uniref:S1 motif domain-containing protein n=1 Tax=Durusdinium trenchii TaxID=1381693 RepID=A0ABP0KYW6_9DINO
MKAQAMEQQRNALGRMESCRQDVVSSARKQLQAVAGLRAEQQQLRRDMVKFQEEMKVLLEPSNALRVLNRGTFHMKAEEQKQRLQKSMEELSVAMRVEQQQHVRASASFGAECDHFAVAGRRVQALLARQTTLQASQLEALEKKTRLDQEDWKEELGRLERYCEEARLKQCQDDEGLALLQAKQEHLEQQISSTEASIQAAYQEQLELTLRSQQAEAALSAACGCTRHLHQQIMHLEQAMQSSSQSELESAKLDSEHKAHARSALRALEADGRQRHLEALSAKLEEGEQVIRTLDVKLNEENAQCDQFTSELSELRRSLGDLQDACQSQQDELVAQRRSAGGAVTELQVDCERLSSEVADVEWEINRLEEHRALLQRLWHDGARRLQRRAGDGEVRGEEEKLHLLKLQLSGMLEQESQLRSEAAAGRQQVASSKLEQSGRLKQKELLRAQEIAELRLRLKEETVAKEQAQEELKVASQGDLVMFKKTEELCLQKVDAARRKKGTVQESRRKALQAATEAMAELQRKQQGLEQQLASVRQRLNQGEQHLHWSRQQLQMQESGPSTRARAEVERLDRAIQQAMDQDASLTKQLEAQQGPRHLKAAIATPASPQAEPQTLHQRPFQTDGFQQIQQKLDSHIHRLQQHTDQLRSSVDLPAHPDKCTGDITPLMYHNQTPGLGAQRPR